MTALKARPYQPDPPPAKRVSLLEAVRTVFDGGNPFSGFPQGDFGSRIGGMHIEGLTRDLVVGGPDSAGGYLKSTKQPMTAIEYFGAILACSRAGAVTEQVGADGFTPIPKVTDPGSGYWLGESNAPTEGSMTFAQVAPYMKSCAANVDFTRNLMMSTGGLAERTVARELFAIVARTVDAAALHGDAGGPLGLANWTGIKSIDGGTFSATKAADLIEGCETGNADTLTAIMAPNVAELLRVRALNGTGSGFILSGGKLLGEIPAIVSNSVSSGYLFVGDFSKMLILQRSIELLLNPYTQHKSGTIEATIYWFGDIIITHPAAFAVATGVN